MDNTGAGGGEVSSVTWHPADSSRLLCLAGDVSVLTDISGGGAREVWRAVHTVRDRLGQLSLVELLQCCSLIGRERQSVEIFSWNGSQLSLLPVG